MPQICTICRHAKRDEIDQALLSEEPLRTIAKRSATSPTALFRHKRDHIATALASAKHVADELQAETLFERLRAINRETAAILAEARAGNSPGLALMAIARAEKQIELEARLLGELSNSVNMRDVTINKNITITAERHRQVLAARRRLERFIDVKPEEKPE